MDAEKTGELVGMVVGVLILGIPFLLVWRSTTWERRFLRAFDRDDRRKARRYLDGYAKSKKPRRLPGYRQMMQRSRYVGLWLLGELDEIRAELAKHEGKGSPSYLANVTMFGLLALAVEDADPAPHVDKLDALAAEVQRETTRLLKSAGEVAAAVAAVAGGLVGRPVTEAEAARFHTLSFNESRLSRILMLRVLVVVAERTGRPGLRFQRTLAGLCKKFAVPPAA